MAFAGSPFPKVTVQELIQQIESRRKAEKKLPTWAGTQGIYFPPKLNVEQTSSEETARYKASLVQGTRIADITGGLGVDSYYFAQKFDLVHHYEQNESLSNIAQHNFSVLNCPKVQCFSQDGTSLPSSETYDWLYADPGRRHGGKGKVFRLQDCEPDLTLHLPRLFGHAPRILVKTSPMLDISIGMQELNYVREVHLVAVQNEMKELLWILDQEVADIPHIVAVNLNGTVKDSFRFPWKHEAEASYGSPERFLYEPNAALMKGGAFQLYSEAYRLRKLHPSTHLYTSESLREFPGRRFIIDKVVPYRKAAIRDALRTTKANITTRNFKESVATLRKKWKLQEGGSQYLFFTTLMDGEQVMLVTSKI